MTICVLLMNIIWNIYLPSCCFLFSKLELRSTLYHSFLNIWDHLRFWWGSVCPFFSMLFLCTVIFFAYSLFSSFIKAMSVYFLLWYLSPLNLIHDFFKSVINMNYHTNTCLPADKHLYIMLCPVHFKYHIFELFKQSTNLW